MAPERLVIELSERMVAESPGAIDNIGRLDALGVRLALDDFGAGHTSLTHLRRLPIDFLKLDRTFVSNAGTSSADRIVLRSVVALAADLGFSIVAEGVENIDQMSIVTKDGAEFVQGFGLYRPMSIVDLGALLMRPIPAGERLSFGDLDLAPRAHTELHLGAPAAPPVGTTLGAALPPPVLGSQVLR